MIVRNVEKPGSFRKIESQNGIQYEYVRIVTVSKVTDNDKTVAAGLPKRGSVFSRNGSSNGNYVCDEVEVNRVEKQVYEVRLLYVPKEIYLPKVSTPASEEPTRWPTEIEWSDRIIEKSTLADANGKLYVNSAGDKLKDTPPKEISHAIVTFSRYEANYDPTVALQYANKVNSTRWYACPAGTAKCFFPRAALTLFENLNRYYWKVTYRFEVAPEGWLTKLADFGKNYLVDETFMSMSGCTAKTGGKTKTSCRDELGNPTQDGEFLDGKGGQLSFGEVKKGSIVYLDFTNYLTIDFNRLRLP
jgi:hypothetical protein